MLGERIYGMAAAMAVPVLRLAAPFSPRLAQGVAGRGQTFPLLETWAKSRPAGRPLAWLHAPSVGEALMAQAIVSALRAARPDLHVAFTFFSPSAERIAPRVGADVFAYLPWDTRGRMRRALAILDPRVVVFVRTEIWPVLVREAVRQGRRTALVNAVLAEGSSRLRGPARALLRGAMARLDAVGAVAPADAARYQRLGVRAGAIRVTGDARFDQVAARVDALDRNTPLLRMLRESARGDPVIVAGSTWWPDEERLIPAFVRAMRGRAARLIIAPHEPTPDHLAQLEARLDAAGLGHARLGELEAGAGAVPAVTVVDRIGVLADLYALADLAWVGGGFGSSGLHSVVEPATLGVPVLYGPRHGNAGEAAALEEAGGGFVVDTAERAADTLRRLMLEPGVRMEAAAAARRFVEERRGGARRNAELILDLLAQ